MTLCGSRDTTTGVPCRQPRTLGSRRCWRHARDQESPQARRERRRRRVLVMVRYLRSTTMREIAERTRLTYPSVRRDVQALERDGLVETYRTGNWGFRVDAVA